jgi:hypothetical protein
MIPTVYIDGKKKDLERDPFLFEEVDERHELIFIDDCTKSLDFESFFTIITQVVSQLIKRVNPNSKLIKKDS